MSWHCQNWTRNLTEGINTFDDGDDCDAIYDDARCSHFDQGAWASVDYDGRVNEYFLNDNGEADCVEHSRTALWDDADHDTAEELRAAGFVVCADCDQTFHDQEAYGDHSMEEHPPGRETIDAGVLRAHLRQPARNVPTTLSAW